MLEPETIEIIAKSILQFIGSCTPRFTGCFCENPVYFSDASSTSTSSSTLTSTRIVTISTDKHPNTTKITTTTPIMTTSTLEIHDSDIQPCSEIYDGICKNGGVCLVYLSINYFCSCPPGLLPPFCER